MPLRGVTFPDHLGFSVVHDFLLENILSNPHFLQYSPSEQYQLTFWKWAIRNLENMTKNEDVEIDPQIYEHYLTLLPSSGLAPGTMRDQVCPRDLTFQKPPSPSYITHYWRPKADASPIEECISLDSFETVTLLESRTTIESGTTGMRTWLASFVLCEFFTRNLDLIRGKRILELGAGIGFLGTILVRLQQVFSIETPDHAIWLTDVNENVLKRCQENLQMPCNMTSTSDINYRFLDWSHALDNDRIAPLKSLLTDEIDASLIVGADIIFDPSLIPALTAVLRLALQPGHKRSPKVAIIAATVRNEDTLAQFVGTVQRDSLHIKELPLVTQDASFIQDVNKDVENVKIFLITL
ncbi:Protein FAM86B1 [Termitomyces sp. T112]|nr:Protein FAM86B1 [Termitomyces sp. T112]